MACRLCLAEVPLCKSHIIPEICFAPMYDDRHRFIAVSDVKKQIVKEGQKGWWEKMLCAACEARLNRYEKHVRRMFTDPLLAPLADKRVYVFPKVEYRLLKLFILSVLWRASVSTLPAYRHVSLGPHEEPMRELILADADFAPETYGCVIWALFDGDRHFVDMMTEPSYDKQDGRRCYRFIMRGFVFMIYVGSRTIDDATSRLFVGRQPEVRAYHINWDVFPFLRQVMGEVAAMP